MSVTDYSVSYEHIGVGYTHARRSEPRIAERIFSALGDAESVLNVGAGTGSYEPPDRDVLAVEPSKVMRAQRPSDAAPRMEAWHWGPQARGRGQVSHERNANGLQ